jgi:hydrogenase-4 component B
MRVGMAAMALFCIILGIAPMFVIPIIDRVTMPYTDISIAGRVLSENNLAVMPTGIGFAGISTPVLMVLLAILIPTGLLVAAAIGGRLRKRYYKTWGCGINLKPRMEYTATGFSQPIKQVFSMIYRPTVKLEKDMLEESQYFAKRMRFETHIDPVFQRYLYDPVVRIIQRLADRIRVIQSGSLHVYLVYIFITLVVLLLWVR